MDNPYSSPNSTKSVDPQHPANSPISTLEEQIDAWRAHLRSSSPIEQSDRDKLEDHLREQIAALSAHGLSEDEAFLLAVKRIGATDAPTREFTRAHSERLWNEIVLSGDESRNGTVPYEMFGSRRMWVALALAVAAAVAIKLPALFGISFDEDGFFYPLNLSLFTLPFIAAYFAWERPLPRASRIGLAAVFLVVAIVVNIFPFSPPPAADTWLLTVLHLPIALWLAVGVAQTGGHWREAERRMDFVRFTGELFIYYVLIALGGGVLIGLTFALFYAIGVDAEPLVESWIVPCGVVGATVVATWLVEAKQNVIESMAPILTRIFTPLFALVLVAFLVTMIFTGRGIDVEREVLIAFDFLLLVVFALLLYTISSRDTLAPPGVLDWISLTLVVTALVVDVLALSAIGSRIAELGFTPNRVAALGMNMVLLVNLAGSAILYARFLRSGTDFTTLWDWQTAYLYVLAAWAAVVAFLFPPVFGFA